jgi:hypothetical protein
MEKSERVFINCVIYALGQRFRFHVWVPGSWTVKDFRENIIDERTATITHVIFQGEPLKDDETMENVRKKMFSSGKMLPELILSILELSDPN